MADAAYAVITKNSRDVTGNFFMDENVLRSEGVTDFSEYSMNPKVPAYPDLYIED